MMKNNDGKFTFINEKDEEIIIDEEAIETEEKRIYNLYFDAYAKKTSFEEMAKNPVWQAPHIGMHEDGTLRIFTDERRVNTKRFIQAKIGKEELKEYSTKCKKEISICNAFLNNIAIDGEKVSVSCVKDKLNAINDSVLNIYLSCTDDNDEQFILTCTNKMVRVMLVDKAKANASVTGFKTLKIADFIDVIVSGLSKEYANKMKD